MTWYEKILRERSSEILKTAIFFIVLALCTLLWSYFTGRTFIWTEIDPVSQPNIFQYRFYSALTFVTLGAYLYRKFKLWKILYALSHDRFSYRQNKRDLWKFLVILTIGFLALIIWTVNSLISIIYNLGQLLLYLAPPLGIAMILFVGYILIKRWKF